MEIHLNVYINIKREKDGEKEWERKKKGKWELRTGNIKFAQNLRYLNMTDKYLRLLWM